MKAYERQEAGEIIKRKPGIFKYFTDLGHVAICFTSKMTGALEQFFAV